MKCQDCHPNPDPGEHMTLPVSAKCMGCHSSIAKDKPAIQRLAASDRAKEPIPWIRVYAVAAGVYWSHRSHLGAGLKCQDCHGDVAQMDRIVRISEVTNMSGCMACHKQRQAPTGCEFCHEGK
ncbi:MAG: hypothetical protein C5B51_10395 [Terriglobia bacterium]|nr:MAG: hypothetical protein C5B51_10395 [Terriglobia bacterium]